MVGDLIPDTGGRLEGIDVFAWTPREFIDLGLLEFCFTDANDAKNQLPFIRERVQQQLQRFAVDVEGMPGAIALRDPRDEPDGRWRTADPRRPGGADHHRPRRRWSRRSRSSSIPTRASPTRRGRVGCSSRPSRRSCGGCTPRPRRGSATSCAPDESRRIDRAAANVTVVAIQSLHEQAQRFVVGALLKETFQQKEATGQRLPLSVIVLDELNKYAPREGTSPLKDMLIDIAQRGRSLGVLLVGAQQTREPRRARGPRERVDPRRPAGWMPPRPNAPSTAGCSRPPGLGPGC